MIGREGPLVASMRRGQVAVAAGTARMNTALMTVGATMAKVGTAATAMWSKIMGPWGLAAAALAMVAKGAGSFADEINKVATMLDRSTMHFLPKYRHELHAMSVEFGESTSALAGGLYQILSATIPTGKALEFLRVSTVAAKAGMSDTRTAADLLTTIIKAYGLEAEQAARVSDQLFTTIKRGKTTFPELAGSLGRVVSTAKIAGVPLHELLAILTVMTRAGINTEESIVALNRAILAFVSPTPAATRVAKDLGIELSAATLRSMGLIRAMGQLANSSIELQTELFPNIRAFKAVTVAAQKYEEILQEADLIVQNVGASQEAFEKTTIGVGHSLRQLWQGLKRAIVALGEMVANTGAIDSLRVAFHALAYAIEQVGKPLAWYHGLWVKAYENIKAVLFLTDEVANALAWAAEMEAKLAAAVAKRAAAQREAAGEETKNREEELKRWEAQAGAEAEINRELVDDVARKRQAMWDKVEDWRKRGANQAYLNAFVEKRAVEINREAEEKRQAAYERGTRKYRDRREKAEREVTAATRNQERANTRLAANDLRIQRAKEDALNREIEKRRQLVGFQQAGTAGRMAMVAGIREGMAPRVTGIDRVTRLAQDREQLRQGFYEAGRRLAAAEVRLARAEELLASKIDELTGAISGERQAA